MNKLGMLMMLVLLSACGTTGRDNSTELLLAPCPSRALAEVAKEPLMPEDATFSQSADRWLFAELLPWARGLAQRSEAVLVECSTR